MGFMAVLNRSGASAEIVIDDGGAFDGGFGCGDDITVVDVGWSVGGLLDEAVASSGVVLGDVIHIVDDVEDGNDVFFSEARMTGKHVFIGMIDGVFFVVGVKVGDDGGGVGRIKAFHEALVFGEALVVPSLVPVWSGDARSINRGTTLRYSIF